MQTTIDDVLNERGKLYGSYEIGMRKRAEIFTALNDLHVANNGRDLPVELRVMLGDIILKLMRIAVSPNHLDSYVDLAGYSKLLKEVMVDEKV